MSFVLKKHDKIEQLSLRHSCSHGFHASSNMHVQQTPDYMICDFQSRAKFIFSLHNTRMKFHTRTRISFGMKTWMNSFPNESHSGIMWIAPKIMLFDLNRSTVKLPSPCKYPRTTSHTTSKGLVCIVLCWTLPKLHIDLCNTADHHYTVRDWQDINFGLL